MSMNDDFYLLQQEVILNDIEEDEQAQKQAQKAKELKDLMEGLKEKIDKNEPIFIGGMADESPEVQMDYVMEKHLERERHEDFMCEEAQIEAEENAQKEKELKDSMTWDERMHYWMLLYPLFYRKKAIEEQFGGNKNILRKICFLKGEEPIKPIYNSILAKDSEILAKWKTLDDEIDGIMVFKMCKEFKFDVYLSLKCEITEAVERDLSKENIPLLYSFTPSDEAIIDKVYKTLYH